MLKRTLFFNNPYHLKVKYEQLVLTDKNSGEVKQAPIEDIGFVILDHPQITLTQSVMQLLAEKKVAVVFCDKKHHPSSMLLNLDGNTIQSELFKEQVKASEPLKKQLWRQTIEAKIKNQAFLLKKLDKPYEQLIRMASLVKSGDSTNQEAIASKFYWKHVFYIKNFRRHRYGMPPNPLLNYGYAILRAAVARALVGSGLLPTLGIHHKSKYNAFCLADDIMEPYRPFVDMTISAIIEQYPDYHVMNRNIKAELLGILSMDVDFLKMKRPLMNGLSITSASLSRCFARKQKKMEYPVLN